MNLSQVVRKVTEQMEGDRKAGVFKEAYQGNLVLGYVRTLNIIADLIEMEGISNPEVKIDEGIIKAKWGDSA